MWRSRLAVCALSFTLVVAPVLSGCFGGGGSGPNGEPTRIAIVTPGADGVGINFVGLTSGRVGFPFVSSIVEAAQGLAILEITLPNGQIVEQQLTIVDDELNTIGVYIPNAPEQPRVVSFYTPVEVTDLALAYYQFINFAESLPLLDYYLSPDGDITDEDPVAEDVDNEEATAFFSVAPGRYQFFATEAGTKNIVADGPGFIDLEAGQLYSTYNYEPQSTGGDSLMLVFEVDYQF